MRIDSSGVIGVNTPSAAQISAGFGQITLNGTSGGVLNFTDDNVEKARLISEVDDFYVQVVGNTIFRNGGVNPSGAEAMRIDSSGNVGIGCTPDTALNAFGYTVLEVAGATTARSGAILLSNSSGTDFGQIYADNTDGWKFVNGQTTKSTIFYGGSGGSEQMRIDASGHVIVKNGGRFYLESSSGFSPFLSESSNDLLFTVNNGERMRIAADGSISTPTAGTSNVRFGSGAGISIASGGIYNVLVGNEAGTAISTGDQNVAIGFEALKAEDTGSRNTAVGAYTLNVLNNDGLSYNTAVGYAAGLSLQKGLQNTLLGALAGDALTSPLANGDASYNTVAGYSALSSDTLGARSTAFGHEALATQNFTSTTITGNTALGFQAGRLVQTGTYNTLVGHEAGTLLTTGTNNTLIGGLAGDALQDADRNVAIGYEALTADDWGSRTVAIGVGAAGLQNYASATDSHNVCIGDLAGFYNVTGVSNTWIGSAAGVGASGQSNSGNTGVGYNAGISVSTGTGNVILGFLAGFYGTALTTGNNNTLIGSYTSATTADAGSAVGLGHSLAAATGYTTVGHGNSDIRAAHGVATWAAVSDERYKKDIVDSEAGLSLINALRPRTFKYKTLGELPETFRTYKADSTEVFKNSETNHGFIAQEVKAAIDADSSIKDGFRLWAERDDGAQEVAEAALIPVLVKAIQELSEQNAALTARIAALEE